MRVTIIEGRIVYLHKVRHIRDFGSRRTHQIPVDMIAWSMEQATYALGTLALQESLACRHGISYHRFCRCKMASNTTIID